MDSFCLANIRDLHSPTLTCRSTYLLAVSMPGPLLHDAVLRALQLCGPRQAAPLACDCTDRVVGASARRLACTDDGMHVACVDLATNALPDLSAALEAVWVG